MGFWTKRVTRRPSRPGIEALEGRAVPATFHVANVAQLQADVAAVSNTSGPNTIVLAPGEYDLTGELQVQNANDLTIRGGDTSKGTINIVGGIGNRVFEIDGGNVTISYVKISAGGTVTQGGGIYAQNANLTVANSTISGNQAVQTGGGIYAQGGTLTVASCTVNNNAASGGAHSFGGAIAASNATVTVENSTIDGNMAFGSDQDTQAAVDGAGGAIYTRGGTLNVSDSTITNNTAYATTIGASADSSGAAIATADTAVSVARSTIEYNTLISLGTQVRTTRGGAISSVGGSLTITNSKFAGNAPSGSNEFDHPGATVVIKHSTVGPKKLLGNYILGDKGFTPIG